MDDSFSVLQRKIATNFMKITLLQSFIFVILSMVLIIIIYITMTLGHGSFELIVDEE